MKKHILVVSLIIFLSLSFNNSLYSQVGIGTPDPNNYAALDIRANLPDGLGILIPNITTSQRIALTGIAPNSLLVFDSDLDMYFSLDANSGPKQWNAFPQITVYPDDDNTATPVEYYKLNPGKPVIIGNGSVSSLTDALAVNGNLRVTGSLVLDGISTLSGTTTIDDNLNITGNLALIGNINSGDIIATSITASSVTVTAPGTISGYGTIPIGGIIMWSGSSSAFDATGLGLGILDGWALCNNQNGTPDLRDKFVYGWDGLTNNLGLDEGTNSFTLNQEQVPLKEHSHSFDLNTTSNNTNLKINTGTEKQTDGSAPEFLQRQAKDNHTQQTSCIVDSGHSHDVTGIITSTEDDSASPVYFSPYHLVVAFIIRIK
jgi:hypothetical protein